MMSQEMTATIPAVDFTRRRIPVTTLSTGFALAVRPIEAQTAITTDTTGLVAGEIKIPVKDGEIPAYRALPDREGSFPVVLVVQEIFGVHEHIKDVCRRFAKQGYLAIAPELYARQGDVSQMTDFTEIREVVSRVPDAQVMSDLDAAVEYAGKTGKGDTKRLAITGFCWGGRIVWLYAAHNPSVKAGAAWYGRLVADPNAPRNPLQPTFPRDVAATLTVPVLGLYGGQDQGIPLTTVEQMRAKLEEGSSSSEIVVYPDAPHAFHADYRPSYRKEAAEDGWQRLLAWFKQHGAA
jgi:carboxymethylenebutenolidase